MNILLVCAAGASTGVLVKKMLKSLEGTDRFDWRIEAHPVNTVSDYEKDFDVILLGPQIAYQIENVKKHTKKPVDIINAIDYGMGKADNVIRQAIKLTE